MLQWLFYAVLAICGIVVVIAFTKAVLKNLKNS